MEEGVPEMEVGVPEEAGGDGASERLAEVTNVGDGAGYEPFGE